MELAETGRRYILTDFKNATTKISFFITIDRYAYNSMYIY